MLDRFIVFVTDVLVLGVCLLLFYYAVYKVKELGLFASDSNIRNKHVLITGGASGIGQQMIDVLTQKDLNTKITSLDISYPNDSSSESVLQLQCDICNPDDLQR